MSWSRPEYAQIATLIAEHTGLTFPASRHRDLEEALERALDRRATDPARLRELLVRDSRARDELIADLTVGESYFFRDPAQFAVLREELLPSVIERRSGGPVRMWSAGCAAGEEAYSLAILGAELGLRERMSVLGTDISRVRLAAARRAAYTKWALRGVSATAVERYFVQRGKQYSLRTEYCDTVDFRYLNLAEDHYPSLTNGIWGLDVILCRNVLIYFDRATIARVARRLVDALSEDGWLLLGGSDPALSELVECDVVLTRAGLAYRRRAERAGDWAPAQPAAAPQPWPDTPPAWNAEADASEQREPFDRIEVADEPLPAAAPVPAQGSVDTEVPEPVHAAYGAHDYARAARLAAELLGARESAALRVLQIRALANMGALAEAERAADAALERYRGSAELLYLHAVLLSEAGRWRDAAAAARRALYLDRAMVVAHIALALALQRVGDRAGARRAFRNAEALLGALAADQVVPASDGETAGGLRASVQAQLSLMEDVA